MTFVVQFIYAKVIPTNAITPHNEKSVAEKIGGMITFVGYISGCVRPLKVHGVCAIDLRNAMLFGCSLII